MRKLFLSFTGCLRAMADGSVSENDLENGLFYFMWPREDVLHPWGDEINELEWFFSDVSEANKAHELLRKNVLKAEEEGRAFFRDRNKVSDSSPFDELNMILRQNGFSVLPLSFSFGAASKNYDPRLIAELLKETDNKVEAVY